MRILWFMVTTPEGETYYAETLSEVRQWRSEQGYTRFEVPVQHEWRTV
jgi:hypothetical protein